MLCGFAAATVATAACVCGGMGLLHLQQHTSSVFYPLVYLIYKAANKWVGMSAKLPTPKTTRFLLFVEVKPCDNRVTEKASTFSRPSPYVMAPRPGLEPGTYGLTEIQARRKHI